MKTRNSRQERLRKLAERVIGERYDSNGAQRILNRGEWTDYWPVVDADGCLTGEIVGNENGYLNVADEAMIREDDCPREKLGDDGYANI